MSCYSLKMLLTFFLWAVVTIAVQAQEMNLTESDDAEFRQGGIAQLMTSGMGGIYGGNGGYQMLGGGNAGGGYANMIRNLYRPSSMGLTDKVKSWVKSFMNRRQHIKPYYNPAMAGLSYAGGDYGAKPMFMGANGYKAISVPLRQLQKYYKPYYGEGGSSQYLQSPGNSVPGSAAANSLLSYSPGGVGGAGSSSGLYASESASPGHFTGSGSSLYGSSPDSSALFGAGAGSGSSLFSSGGATSGLFSSGGSPSSGIFGSQGGSAGLFTASEGGSSSLYNLPSFASGGIYSQSGSPASGFYPGSSGNSGAFNLDSSNSGIYGSDSNIYGSNGGEYGSSAAASSLMSVNSGVNGGGYGDLYASAANQNANLYNPSMNDNQRGYSSGSSGKSQYGGSSSSLYVPSSSGERGADSSYGGKSAKDNGYTGDSSRGSQHETSYSVSFQAPQSKSYSSSFQGASFQPVSYSSDGSSATFQEKSSS